MKSVLLRTAMMLVAATYCTMNLTACNTVEGMGKDTEKVGEKVQDVADDAKN